MQVLECGLISLLASSFCVFLVDTRHGYQDFEFKSAVFEFHCRGELKRTGLIEALYEGFLPYR